MRVLKIEPFAGISGDMFVAAAARLADAEDEVAALPSRLGLDGVSVRFRPVDRGSIRGLKMDVLLHDEPADAPVFAHDHGHDHDHKHAHHGSHRHLRDILHLVDHASLDERVKRRAGDLFRLLGEAEAEVHGIPLERVHFHEVGAVDSILDVVAAAWLIERLQVEAVYCEPVCTGYGAVRIAHGTLPIPAPATERLLRGMPTTAGTVEGEMTTPTGAAILRHLAPRFERPVVTVHSAAYGAGTRDHPERPNVLRLGLGEVAAERTLSEAVLIQTNIDDMTGELLGSDLANRLLENGALDVVFRQVLMKKGRPGVQLEVLALPDEADGLARFVLEHTTTLGVRLLPVRRWTLARARITVETPYGPVAVKRATLPSGRYRDVPEYEDCRAAAERAGVPVDLVYRTVLGYLVRET